MRTRHLTAVIEMTENNYCAYVQEVDGVGATGKTIAEVKESLLDALDFLVESCEEDGEEIPEVLQGKEKRYSVSITSRFLSRDPMSSVLA